MLEAINAFRDRGEEEFAFTRLFHTRAAFRRTFRRRLCASCSSRWGAPRRRTRWCFATNTFTSSENVVAGWGDKLAAAPSLACVSGSTLFLH